MSAAHAIPLEARLFDHLFLKEQPMDVDPGTDWVTGVNPASLERLTEAWGEPSLKDVKPGDRFQFERNGYFCCDPDSQPGKPVFNRSVKLRDTWAKIEKKGS